MVKLRFWKKENNLEGLEELTKDLERLVKAKSVEEKKAIAGYILDNYGFVIERKKEKFSFLKKILKLWSSKIYR